MPLYGEIIAAAQETATKLLYLRQAAHTKASVGIYFIRVDAGGGHTACVEWSPGGGDVTISLPTMLPSASLSRAEADRIVGYIAHECCHVLHTDKAQWKLAVKAGARVQAWTNALEDVRIEKAEIDHNAFPNLRNVLGAMMNTLHGEAGVALHRKGLPPMGNERADAPYYACLLGRLANGYAIPAAGGLSAALSPSLRPVVEMALSELPACKDTESVRKLAERLTAFELLHGQESQGQGEQGEKSQGQGEQGEKSQGQGEQGEKSQGQGEQGEKSQGQGEQGEKSQGQGEQGEKSQGQGEQGEEGKATKPAGRRGGGRGGKGAGAARDLGAGLDPSPSLEPVAQAVAERTPGKVLGKSRDADHHFRNATYIKQAAEAAGALVRVDDRTARMTPDPVQARMAHEAFAKALPRASVLQGEIARMLISEEVRQCTHHEHHGRLDRRALTRMRAGATDVFSRRRDRPGVETAVLINVDLSSSMHDGGRMGTALQTAWHLANAAEMAGARVAIVGFEATAIDTVLHMAKGFADPLQQVARRIERLRPRGGTHLAPAIMGGARLLTGTGANRLIQIMVTDGMCHYGPVAVAECCVIARDTMGVETVAVGIMAADVVHVFPGGTSVNIDRLTDLTHGALRTLATVLEDGTRPD